MNRKLVGMVLGGAALASAMAWSGSEAKAQTNRREGRIEARNERQEGRYRARKYGNFNNPSGERGRAQYDYYDMNDDDDVIYYGNENAVLGVTLSEGHDGMVRIADIRPESPADQAGLRPGDAILAIENRDVYSYRDVVRMIGRRDPGDRVRIEFDRRGRQREVVATLVSEEELARFTGERGPGRYDRTYRYGSYGRGYERRDHWNDNRWADDRWDDDTWEARRRGYADFDDDFDDND